MKNLNRWIYAFAGVVVLMLAGLVYAWSMLAKSIGAAFPDWTAAQLSMTFTITMTMFCVGCLLAGILLLLALKTGSFTFIILGFIVGGFAYGGVTPTNSAIISDFFGRKNYPMNFSMINTNLIIASFASAIAGKLYDASQSYMSTIVMMIGVTVVGFIVFLGIRRPEKRGLIEIMIKNQKAE